MKNLVFFGMLLLMVFSCNRDNRVDTQNKQTVNSDVKAEAQYKNELDEIKRSIQGETKIKVKKDTKGYSWEITGKDPQEVLKANDALRKRLGD